jgi:hypothetical protein
LTGECLYPQLMAKARAATSDESRIRAPFARPTGAKRWLRPLRSLAVEDVQPVDGGSGFGAGGDAELGQDCWTRGRWRSWARWTARWR